jgi:opacity protein-like surface antigen
MLGFSGLKFDSFRWPLTIAIALFFCATLSLRSAQAQLQQSPCLTPEVQERIGTLQKRVERYDRYLADAQIELISLQGKEADEKKKWESNPKLSRSAWTDARYAVSDQTAKIARFEKSIKDWKDEITRLAALPPCAPKPQAATPPVTSPADTPQPPRPRFGCYQSLAGSPAPSTTSCSQVITGVELGGGWGKAKYDDETFDTSGFIAGASVGLRSYQANNQVFGVQLSVLSTNMRARDIDAGLKWAVPLDFQVGGVFQSPVAQVPVTAYVFVGPMWGQVRVKDSFSTEYFSMFGLSAGVGLEVQVSDQWSVGTKVRAYGLGSAERKADGQQQSGVLWTANLSYAFNPRW